MYLYFLSAADINWHIIYKKKWLQYLSIHILCLEIICCCSSSRRQYQRRHYVRVWRGKNLWISLTVRDRRHDGASWRPNAQLHSAKTQHQSGPTASRSIYRRPKRGSESHREHLYNTIIIILSNRASLKYHNTFIKQNKRNRRVL